MPLLKSVVYGEIPSARSLSTLFSNWYGKHMVLVSVPQRVYSRIFNKAYKAAQQPAMASQHQEVGKNFETCCVLTYFRSGLL